MEPTDLGASFAAVAARRRRRAAGAGGAAAGDAAVPQKRYRPAVEDYVVGVVVDRNADGYRVDLPNATCGATLSALAFEGATKRHRPALAIGDAVYARVRSAKRGADAELTCAAKRGSRKEWTTGKATFGKLEAGPACAIAAVAPAYVGALLARDAAVLTALAAHVKYEVAVGHNGAVWLRSNSTLDSIIVRNAIENAQHLETPEIKTMVDQIVAALHARTTLLAYEAGSGDAPDGGGGGGDDDE